jgi:hypothetical protein
MRLFSVIVLVFLFANVYALQNTKAMEKYTQKNGNTPCVQAFLNAEPLNCGIFVSKKAKGIITVSKDNINKIYFNVTLKSNIGKKDEPPVYLRFIKQKSLDINELMDYAEEGDEIYIEEFIPSVNKIDLSCAPANFTVSNNL